jgi:hypothetical protein
MTGTITCKTKGKAKERPIQAQQLPGTKEGKELVVPLLYKANWETSGKNIFLV